MAIKRTGTLRDPKATKCLKCGMKAEKFHWKDDTIHECTYCGQKHFVDIYGNKITMTIVERPELRRRLEQLPTNEQIQIKSLRQQLSAALAEAEKWKESAEGLERILEHYKMKEIEEK